MKITSPKKTTEKEVPIERHRNAAESMSLKRDNANRRIPVSHKYPLGDLNLGPCDGKQTGSPLNQ
jgi:hypothetical protein